ncbi:MAG: stage III sporulation protein AF [Roseburia sp.]
MTQFLACVKSYTVFFLLMMLLIQLIPKESYRKYIQFFMGMLLVFAFLSPVITLLFDSGEFFELVEYETFQEQLEELEKDTDRIEFLQQDYYEEQCKKIIERELEQIALSYDYEIEETELSYTDEGKINKITLVVKEKDETTIEIAKVSIGIEEKRTEELEEDCSTLLKSICDYYQIEEEEVEIFVAGNS